jgi:hypothetical protein
MLVAEAIYGLKQKHSLSYAVYLRTLMGAFQDSFMGAPFFRSDSVLDFEMQADVAANQLKSSLEGLPSDLKKLANLVPYQASDINQKTLVGHFHQSLSDEIQTGLVSQARKDARQFRQVAVETFMGLLLDGQATNPVKFQKNVTAAAQKRLVMLARNGARHKSEVYVSVLLNWCFHRAYNETFIYLGSLSNKKDFGAVSSVTGDSLRFTKDQYYSDEFQKKVFHPNTSRIVID